MGKDAVTTDAIAVAIDGLHAMQNSLLLEQLDWIIEYDGREAWTEDGACSMADWLAYRLGHSLPAARELVRVARALKDLPRIRASFGDGRLSWERLALVTQVADEESDELWASEAEQLSLARLQRWVREHTGMRREEAERQLRERYLRLRAVDGTLHINGRLHGDDAAYVKQAIEHLAERAPKLTDGTYAPYEHRCADALVELACTRLGELDRATVVVHIDADRLNHTNGMGVLEHGPSVVAETVRRLACDGKVELSVDDHHGSPLKLGRTKRTVPPWQRRQLAERDEGCRFGACERRRGLQIHHINHWAHGGPTDDDNLLSLCPYHHRLVHEGGWRIRTDEQHNLRFIRPDGRPLNDRPTPLDPRIRERLFGGSQRE